MRDLGDELGDRVDRRVGGVDALDAVLGHQHDLGVQLGRPQRGGGVGREERVAGAGGEDHDPALLEVAHRAAADVRLGDLGDRDRRLHPGRDVLLLERVLERQRVEHRREHPHVVAGRAVHAPCAAAQSAVDVAAADDDRDLDAAPVDGGDLAGDRLHARGIGAVLELAHQRLARELQQHALVDRRRHVVAACLGVHRAQPPTANRAKRRITTFSPRLAGQRCAQLLDRLAAVLVLVDVLLAQQHDLVEPLVELAGDDPLAHVLGPVGGLLGRDPLLALAVLGRDVLLADGERRRGRDVQRQVARELDELLVARHEVGLAVDLDQHADLVAGVDVALHDALARLRSGALGRLRLARARRISTAFSMSPPASASALRQSACPRRCGRAGP